MTKIDLQRVLDLDAESSKGPWESDFGEVSQHWSCPEPWATIVSREVDCSDYCYGGTARGIEKPEDAELIAYYRTAAPAMAKALQEVIALHVETGGKECLTCTDERGPEPYPCPTVQAIHYHLGEQE